eukprot:7575150-Alexandrium_andersonii.AAC.1
MPGGLHDRRRKSQASPACPPNFARDRSRCSKTRVLLQGAPTLGQQCHRARKTASDLELHDVLAN